MKYILIVTFCYLMMIGCKKDHYDYRHKYTGDYYFSMHHYGAYGLNPVTTYDTSYTDEGKIENGTDNNSVLISSSSFSIRAIIYEDGTLIGYWDNNGKGEFVSTIKVNYSYGNLWPGGNWTTDVIGMKK